MNAERDSIVEALERSELLNADPDLIGRIADRAMRMGGRAHVYGAAVVESGGIPWPIDPKSHKSVRQQIRRAGLGHVEDEVLYAAILAAVPGQPLRHAVSLVITERAGESRRAS